MHPVDRRIVELVIIGKHRPLKPVEATEYEESRFFVINREWKRARVLNLMKLARETHDWDWFEQLTVEYEQVMKLY